MWCSPGRCWGPGGDTRILRLAESTTPGERRGLRTERRTEGLSVGGAVEIGEFGTGKLDAYQSGKQVFRKA